MIRCTFFVECRGGGGMGVKSHSAFWLSSYINICNDYILFKKKKMICYVLLMHLFVMLIFLMSLLSFYYICCLSYKFLNLFKLKKIVSLYFNLKAVINFFKIYPCWFSWWVLISLRIVLKY